MTQFNLGDRVEYDGRQWRIVDTGTIFIPDSWWIEDDNGDQMMVMGSDLKLMVNE